jgi:hypothetical protein
MIGTHPGKPRSREKRKPEILKGREAPLWWAEIAGFLALSVPGSLALTSKTVGTRSLESYFFLHQ